MFEERLRAAAEHVAALGYAPAYVSLHGSQNYGLAIHTDEYQSDYDFKCVVLPSLWDLVEGRKPASLTVETAEGQIDIKDIRVLCDALERMNPAYLESLATAHHLVLPEGERMREIRALLPRLMAQRGRYLRAPARAFLRTKQSVCVMTARRRTKRLKDSDTTASRRITCSGCCACLAILSRAAS